MNFDKKGLLPPGDYELTFEEIRQSVLVKGPENRDELRWDSSWRLYLVDNAEILSRQLRDVGIQNIFLDGSFVELKPHPNDIDGYFEVDLPFFASGKFHREINKIDPHKCWTWDKYARRAYRGYVKKQLPMWHIYRVEFYPHHPGVTSGIIDKFGNDMPFPSAFRQRRSDGAQKGIIKVKM